MIKIYAGYGNPEDTSFRSMEVTCGAITSDPSYQNGPTNYTSLLMLPSVSFNNRTQYLDTPSTSAITILSTLLGLEAGVATFNDIPIDTVINFYSDEECTKPMGMKLYIEAYGNDRIDLYVGNKEYGMYFRPLEDSILKSATIPDYAPYYSDTTPVAGSMYFCFIIPLAYRNCTTWEEAIDVMIDNFTTYADLGNYSYMEQALIHCPLLFGYHITHRYWSGGDNYYAVGARETNNIGASYNPNCYYRGQNMRCLTTISAWYFFLLGKHIYNEVDLENVSLELQEPVNGIDRIHLGKSIFITKQDDVLTVSSDDGFNDEGYGIGIREVTPATDLLSLVDMDHMVITLKNGDTLTFGGDTQRVTLDIKAANKDLIWVWANSYSGGTALNSNYTGFGVFLAIPEAFSTIPSDTWIESMEGFSGYAYNEAPIYVCSHVACPFVRVLKTDLWDYTTNPNGGPAGFITEYAVDTNTTSAYVSVTSNDDLAFWEELITNIPSDEPEPYNPGTGHIGGGTSGTGGGNGEYDDTGDSVGAGTPPALLAPHTSHMYRATNADLTSIMAFINNASEEEVRSKYVSAVMNISLVGIPKSWSMSLGTAEDFKLAGTDTHVDLQPLRTQYITGSLGTFKIDEYFGTFLDYDPYTQIQIYLPYVGFTDLSANEIIGNECELVASIDLMSGLIQYQLMSKDANTGRNIVILSVNGQCASQYPLTALDYNGKVMSIVGTIAGAITFGVGIAAILASHGAAAPLVAGIMTTAGGASATVSSGMAASRAWKGTTVRSGATAGCTGHMSVHRPYIIISRPKQNIPETFAHEYGFRSHISARLGDLHGFTKVEDIHLENMGDITQDELEELESILKSGVIL